MKRWSTVSVKVALIAVVVAPLCVSLAWRAALGVCDYIAQAGLLLLMFVLPFCTRPGSGFGRHFALFYTVGFIWGVWRGFYFDPLTQNDIPGIGYLILPLMMGGISALIFVARVWLHGRNSNRAL
jgi:hypothetical protein